MVIVTSPTAPFLKRVRLLPLLTCILLQAFTPAAFAQTEVELDHLIFDPVVLPADGSEPPELPQMAGTAEPAASEPDAATGAPVDPADIERYRASIDKLLAEESPYSQSLREQYDSLATLLQQNGEHDAAIAALENAMHIDRINGGLFTLDQIPLVEKLIVSHAALGNFDEVDDYKGYLFYVQQRTFEPDDPRLIAAKEEWADWNVEAFLRESVATAGGVSFSTSAAVAGSPADFVAIQNPRTGAFNYVPRSQLPFIMGPGGAGFGGDLYTRSTAYSVSPELLVDERLRTARDMYEDIIEARAAPAAANAGYDAEHKIASIGYAIKRQMDEIESNSNPGSLYYGGLASPRTDSDVVRQAYAKSTDALEKIATELEQNPDSSAVERANAYIYLGDWHVGFERFQRGNEAYAKAWQILQDAQLNADGIAAVFAPEPLIQVPAFAVHDFSREIHGIPADADLPYKGYIDATLSVDRYGKMRNLKIVGESPEAPQRIRGILLDHLRASRVRPLVRDGEAVQQPEMRIRYYYTY